MTENDNRPTDEQPREPESPPEVPEGATEYIKGLVDARVAAFYKESWPTVLQAVVTGVAERPVSALICCLVCCQRDRPTPADCPLASTGCEFGGADGIRTRDPLPANLSAIVAPGRTV